jgi:cell filamentation protein
VSKYQFAESDIYLPGADIPRNRLGIETPDLLHEVEATLLQQAYTRFITELEPVVR